MASADLRDELNCSICLNIYTDPVTLPCGHNFCKNCIGNVLGTQERLGVYTCPECRAEFQDRPVLQTNKNMGNIAERFLSTQPEPGDTGICCTYCDNPVPAIKSCLQCETSLCIGHLEKHNRSVKHVIIEPTTHWGYRKCSVHDELLKYYCCEDEACICVSCCLAGDHRGHKVELLNEASEKKKEKLRTNLDKLFPEIEETEKRVQNLQENMKELQRKVTGVTERVIVIFKDIREQLEALERRVLSEISSQADKLSLTLTNLLQQLELKKDEVSLIEHLCNMTDPLIVLREWKTDNTIGGGNRGDHKRQKIDRAMCDVEVDLISETLITGLSGIVNGVKEKMIYGQEANDMLLDIKTAGNDVSVSGDSKSATYSHADQRFLAASVRFQYPQVLSTRSFSSGQHYWEIEGSESGGWRVGVTYPSIGRKGLQSCIGNNDKSWCLYKWGDNTYSVIHDSNDTDLSRKPSCRRIRISLDYETGRLSFYELSDPIRHLHTFTAPFTEPLHAAFGVRGVGAWVRIIT